jgi:hypothetical protein
VSTTLNWNKVFLVFLILGILTTSCSRTTNQQGEGNFLPPTALPQPTTAPTTAIPATQPVDCTNTLSFDSDITIPDGTEVKPGQEIDKRWQVRNNGSCDWNDQYSIHIIAGESMGSPEVQALFPARSGSAAVIRMMLTAPSEPGTYRSAWQAYNPDDQPFGDPFYIEIIVEE